MDREGDSVMKDRTIETFSIHTLGCRSNQYDTSAIESELSSGGLKLVPFTTPADACIINTCTVTGRTDAQSRQAIRKARRLNSESLIIVTGCYAQVSAKEVAEIEGVDFVLGNPEKDQVLKYLQKGHKIGIEGRVAVGPSEEGTPLSLRANSIATRTRANLKIQDGCDRSCTYCIIPMARGRSKSLPMETILNEIESLTKQGFKEFVFTGIHLGGWGIDLPNKPSFASLLANIEERSFPARFRISSIDPDEVTDELINIIKDAKTICKHLHMPIQSGSDTVLKLMGRPYTAGFFRDRVEKIAGLIPSISIGTDIITGFPGESDKEFEETRALIEALPLSYLHLFPYSKRKGTPAASFPGQVHGTIIKKRSTILREIDKTKRTEFHVSFVGSKMSVLVEGSRDKRTGLAKGRSSNYIPVLIKDFDKPSANGTTGQFSEVLLKEADSQGMCGVVCV